MDGRVPYKNQRGIILMTHTPGHKGLQLNVQTTPMEAPPTQPIPAVQLPVCSAYPRPENRPRVSSSNALFFITYLPY